jgi:hypothetical protein
MGHSSILVTYDVYGHLSRMTLRIKRHAGDRSPAARLNPLQHKCNTRAKSPIGTTAAKVL